MSKQRAQIFTCVIEKRVKIQATVSECWNVAWRPFFVDFILKSDVTSPYSQTLMPYNYVIICYLGKSKNTCPIFFYYLTDGPIYLFLPVIIPITRSLVFRNTKLIQHRQIKILKRPFVTYSWSYNVMLTLRYSSGWISYLHQSPFYAGLVLFSIDRVI